MGMIVNPFASAVAGGGPPFANVLILCHFDGTNGSTGPYTNSATATGAPTVSNGGNTSLDTSIKKFGTASVSGVGGGVVASDTTQARPGTGDFTTEVWFYTAIPTYGANTIFDFDDYQSNNTKGFGVYGAGDGKFHVKFNGSVQCSVGTISTSTFQHVAYSRASGVGYLGVDGSILASFADTNNYDNTNGYPWECGRDARANFTSISHLDDWRVTIGYGLYITTYTPPIAAHPDS